MTHIQSFRSSLSLTLLLASSALFSTTLAQSVSAPLTLERAVQQALNQNAEVLSAASALGQAQSTLVAKEKDPNAIVTDLLTSRQAAQLAAIQLTFVRLEVTSDAVNEFFNLAENKDALETLTSQVKLSTRQLEIARARLAVKTATPVEVQRAENDLGGARQQLTDATAARPVVAARLARVLGLERGTTLVIAEPPAVKARAVNLGALEQNLDDRVLAVVQAAQALEAAELNVKVSTNDYTAEQTQREARTNLENARRALNTATRRALTQTRDAYRGAQDALEGAAVASKARETADRTLQNDGVRLQNGLIARVELEASQLTALKARHQAAQATNAYLRALSALSLASGTDVTGLRGN